MIFQGYALYACYFLSISPVLFTSVDDHQKFVKSLQVNSAFGRGNSKRWKHSQTEAAGSFAWFGSYSLIGLLYMNEQIGIKNNNNKVEKKNKLGGAYTMLTLYTVQVRKWRARNETLVQSRSADIISNV